MSDRDPGVNQGEAKAAKAGKPRRKWAGKVALIVLGATLAAILVWVALSLTLLRRSPLCRLPGEFAAYVRVASVGAFAKAASELKAADIVLAAPGMGPAREALRAAREGGLFEDGAIAWLLDMSADIAVGKDGSVLAVVDLGPRGLLSPLAHLVLPFLHIPGLEIATRGGARIYSYIPQPEKGAKPRIAPAEKARPLAYAAIDANLLVVSMDEEGLLAALSREASESLEALPGIGEAGSTSGSELRIVADSAAILSAALPPDGGPGAILDGVEFPSYCALGLSIANDRISLRAELPLSSTDPAVQALVDSRSRAPSALAAVPAETRWISLLQAGRAKDLLALLLPYMGEGARKTCEDADTALRLALGLGLDGLFLDWAGAEMGAFGVEGSPDPVYFVAIADEAARRAAFDRALGSIVLVEDDSVLVDGIRVPRLSFPPYVAAVLGLAGLRVPEPSYIVEGGFLFLSASPRNLASLKKARAAGEVLARSAAYREATGGMPADAAALVLYDLSESLPFFLRGSGVLESVLKLYRRGSASIAFEGGLVRLALEARAVAGGGARALPGFPFKAGSRVGEAFAALRFVRGGPVSLAYVADGSLVMREALSGKEARMELSPESAFAVELEAGSPIAKALWVVEPSGAVYRFGEGLSALGPFPLATGERPSSPPAFVLGRLVVPVRKGPALLAVLPDGHLETLPIAPAAPLLSPPTAFGGKLAFYPKSFDNQVELVALDGTRAEGWPRTVSGIAFGSPFAADGDRLLGFLTQAGELSLWKPDGSPLPGFPLSLPGPFRVSPVAAEAAVYCLSEDGTLYRALADASASSLALALPGASGARLAALDIDVDGRAEILSYGSRDAISGWTAELTPLQGFPLKGGKAIALGDLDGDGSPDIVSLGFDGEIRAYAYEGAKR